MNNTVASAQVEFGQPQYDPRTNTITLDEIIHEVMNGGKLDDALRQAYGLGRKARGSF